MSGTFVGSDGSIPTVSEGDPTEETMYKQLMDGWGDKLWWVHSEAMYSALMFGERTNDATLAEWFERVFDYTFEKHRNPDREVREWLQILTREGKPQDKVTGLPVKDPFHITRDLIFILIFLYGYSDTVKL